VEPFLAPFRGPILAPHDLKFCKPMVPALALQIRVSGRTKPQKYVEVSSPLTTRFWRSLRCWLWNREKGVEGILHTSFHVSKDEVS